MLAGGEGVGKGGFRARAGRVITGEGNVDEERNGSSLRLDLHYDRRLEATKSSDLGRLEGKTARFNSLSRG